MEHRSRGPDAADNPHPISDVGYVGICHRPVVRSITAKVATQHALAMMRLDEVAQALATDGGFARVRGEREKKRRRQSATRERV